MEDENRKIKNIIESLINKFKEDPDRWSNEKEIHYEFFSLLFDYFLPQDIRNNFRWEYIIGVPDYGTTVSAKVDLCYFNLEDRFIAIEIEGPYQSPGDKKGGMKDEIEKCVRKLHSAPTCYENLEIGYIVPFYYWKDRFQKARGYDGKTYEELIDENFQNAERFLNKPNKVVILKDGVFFGN